MGNGAHASWNQLPRCPLQGCPPAAKGSQVVVGKGYGSLQVRSREIQIPGADGSKREMFVDDSPLERNCDGKRVV